MITILIHSTDKTRRDTLSAVLAAQNCYTVAVVATTVASKSFFDSNCVDILLVDTNFCGDAIADFLLYCKEKDPLTWRVLLRDEQLTATYRILLSQVHGSLPVPSNRFELKRFVERIAIEFPQRPPVVEPVEEPGPVKKTVAERVTSLLEFISVSEPTQATVAELIAADREIARIVIKRINSPFYGLATRIESIDRAILLMGLNATIACLEESIADKPVQVA